MVLAYLFYLFNKIYQDCHPRNTLDGSRQGSYSLISRVHSCYSNCNLAVLILSVTCLYKIIVYSVLEHINLFPLIPACTARPGLPLSPPETAFLESPYYRPQTASIGDRHHPTNFHSVTYTQSDDAAFEAGSDNDHKSFLRMRVIFKVEYPAELFRFRRVLDDILSSFDVF